MISHRLICTSNEREDEEIAGILTIVQDNLNLILMLWFK